MAARSSYIPTMYEKLPTEELLRRSGEMSRELHRRRSIANHADQRIQRQLGLLKGIVADYDTIDALSALLLEDPTDDGLLDRAVQVMGQRRLNEAAGILDEQEGVA